MSTIKTVTAYEYAGTLYRNENHARQVEIERGLDSKIYDEYGSRGITDSNELMEFMESNLDTFDELVALIKLSNKE